MLDIKNSGHIMLNNLLCMMVICKEGLCVTELIIIGKEMVKSSIKSGITLSPYDEEGNSLIELYIGIITDMNAITPKCVQDETDQLFFDEDELQKREALKS